MGRFLDYLKKKRLDEDLENHAISRESTAKAWKIDDSTFGVAFG